MVDSEITFANSPELVISIYSLFLLPLGLYVSHDILDGRWRHVPRHLFFATLYCAIFLTSCGVVTWYAVVQGLDADWKEVGAAMLAVLLSSVGFCKVLRIFRILRAHHALVTGPVATLDALVVTLVPHAARECDEPPRRFYARWLRAVVRRALHLDRRKPGDEPFESSMSSMSSISSNSDIDIGDVPGDRCHVLSSAVFDDDYPTDDSARIQWLRHRITVERNDSEEAAIRLALFLRLVLRVAQDRFIELLSKESEPMSARRESHWHVSVVGMLERLITHGSAEPTPRIDENAAQSLLRAPNKNLRRIGISFFWIAANASGDDVDQALMLFPTAWRRAPRPTAGSLVLEACILLILSQTNFAVVPDAMDIGPGFLNRLQNVSLQKPPASPPVPERAEAKVSADGRSDCGPETAPVQDVGSSSGPMRDGDDLNEGDEPPAKDVEAGLGALEEGATGISLPMLDVSAADMSRSKRDANVSPLHVKVQAYFCQQDRRRGIALACADAIVVCVPLSFMSSYVSRAVASEVDLVVQFRNEVQELACGAMDELHKTWSSALSSIWFVTLEDVLRSAQLAGIVADAIVPPQSYTKGDPSNVDGAMKFENAEITWGFASLAARLRLTRTSSVKHEARSWLREWELSERCLRPRDDMFSVLERKLAVDEEDLFLGWRHNWRYGKAGVWMMRGKDEGCPSHTLAFRAFIHVASYLARGCLRVLGDLQKGSLGPRHTPDDVSSWDALMMKHADSSDSDSISSSESAGSERPGLHFPTELGSIDDYLGNWERLRLARVSRRDSPRPPG